MPSKKNDYCLTHEQWSLLINSPISFFLQAGMDSYNISLG